MKSINNPEVRKEIEVRVCKLKPATEGLWGKMTANEMICHLSDTLRVTLGEKKAKGTGKWYDKTIMKWLALSPVPWPRGKIVAPAEVNQEKAGIRPIEFEKDKEVFLKLLSRYAEKNADYNWPQHPILGQLSYWQWGRFHYVHFNHHLKQFGV
ncbi:MAG: DUF1569 domain-containing protein [Blastocatellia bacterium]|nr:DUF1569 domain-containing protein [Blastocatellia bacterium]